MLDGAPPAPETVASLQQQIRDHVASGRSDKAQETACKLYLLNLQKRRASPGAPYTSPAVRDLENRLEQCVRSGDMFQARKLLDQIQLMKSKQQHMPASPHTMSSPALSHATQQHMPPST